MKFQPVSTKNKKRYPSFFTPEGSPKKVRVYDNGGDTLDRYTIVFSGTYRKNPRDGFLALGSDGNPFHPMGVGYPIWSDTMIDRPRYSHLGKKVRFEDLSVDLKKYVLNEYKFLWGFTDESGLTL